MSKYKNVKVTVNGETFDSKKEYERWCQLKLLERAGMITDLKRQVKFVLIPAQREESKEVYKKGQHKGEPKPGKLLEKECAYIADFVYKENGQLVVEDTKGMKTEVYKVKRKLMLSEYDIRIKEV